MNTTGTNKSNDSPTGAIWVDLFLALIYAATILLLLMWLSGRSIPGLSDSVIQGTRGVWAWVISGVSGAVLSAVLRKQLSKLVLVFTVVLCLALPLAVRLMGEKPCPIPAHLAAEMWTMHEGGPNVRTIGWSVKFDGTEFSCKPDGSFNTNMTCIATGWGKQRAIERVKASDGNHCVFYGTIQNEKKDGKEELIGTYNCNTSSMAVGPYPWTAEIESREN